MLGAIAGDICGAPWEGGQCANGEFQLFAEGASITDDSVCTVAIAQALMQHGDAVQVAESLRTWCKRYPGLGYGSAFNHWVYSRKGPITAGAMAARCVCRRAAGSPNPWKKRNPWQS